MKEKIESRIAELEEQKSECFYNFREGETKVAPALNIQISMEIKFLEELLNDLQK